MALSYHCQNCGSDLVFDADHQQMYCQHCGKLIDNTELVSTGEKLDSIPPISQEPHGVEYHCESCGATIVTDENTAATFCVFCGNSAIITQRLSDEYKPELVLPFAFGKENAKSQFLGWCQNSRVPLKPDDIANVTGVYLPCWLFDYTAHIDVVAEGTKVKSEISNNTTTTTTSFYAIQRKQDVEWNRIPRDGASRFDDGIMSVLEPYEYKYFCDFDMKYLAGFYADKYDVSSEQLMPSVQQQVQGYADNVYHASVSGYHSTRKIQDRTVYDHPKVTYALLPVWFINYKYTGKQYSIVMNGQTGKIVGNPPVRRPKILRVSLATFLGTILLFFLMSLLVANLFGNNLSRTTQVYDDANLFTTSEKQAIEETLKDMMSYHDINAFVITVADKGTYSDSGGRISSYALERYKELTFASEGKGDYSGFLLLIDMQDGYLHITTYDEVKKQLSTSKATAITKAASNLVASGEYGEATLQVLDDIGQKLDKHSQNTVASSFVTGLLFSLPITGIVALILLLTSLSQGKNKRTVTIQTYMNDSISRNKQEVDNFLRSTVSVVHHPSSEDKKKR